jgi:hypothetical protein
LGVVNTAIIGNQHFLLLASCAGFGPIVAAVRCFWDVGGLGGFGEFPKPV